VGVTGIDGQAPPNIAGVTVNLIKRPGTEIGLTGTTVSNEVIVPPNPDQGGDGNTNKPPGPPTGPNVPPPITNTTNLLDISVPPGTLIASRSCVKDQGGVETCTPGTVNITGNFTNSGFIYTDVINIEETVNTLINGRRLANPGTVEFEAGGGNWIFERGDRLQPGGFISAAEWNINAQTIQSIMGTFQLNGLNEAQTAQLTAFLQGQLRELYGANLTEQQLIEAITTDFHRNKKPNQLRMIIAIVVAIIIVIATQGTGAAYVNAILGAGTVTGATAVAVSAAFTALLTSISTQLITTGRIDGRALFQNILVAALTAGLTQGLTNFAGSEGWLNGTIDATTGNFIAATGTAANATTVNSLLTYGLRATVAASVSSAITGGDFGRAFTGSLLSSVSADAAKWIGDTLPRTDVLDSAGRVIQQANPVGNILAHAVLGCASAAAAQQGCASGAIGGAVGELVAPVMGSVANNLLGAATNSPTYNATVQSLSTLTAGLVTQALGHNGVTAANTASNAVQNNFLNHAQVDELAERLRNCSDQQCRENAFDIARQQSLVNDLRLAGCASAAACEAVLQEFREGIRARQEVYAGSHAGLTEQDLTRIAQTETGARALIRAGLVGRCASQECQDNAAFVRGAARALAGVTPAGMVAGAGMGSYALMTSFIENGLYDTTANIFSGIANIPGHLIDALNSKDPEVRGEALGTLLTLGGDVGVAVRQQVASRITARVGFTEQLKPREGGSLTGAPELPPRNASPDQVRAINRQNESATTLRDHGFEVEQLPNTGRPGGNPDLRVNGAPADVYAPTSKNPMTIRDNIIDKVDRQAPNVVVNLNDSPMSTHALINYLKQNPVPNLNSVIIIKGPNLTRFTPPTGR
jgi:hypothetical protein